VDSDDFEAFLAQARQIREVVERVYEEVTGEKLDLESAVRHYPLLTLGLVAGTAGAAGWWLGRKKARQLPPNTTMLDGTQAPLQRLEDGLPKTVDRFRRLLSELMTSDEAKRAAKHWFVQSVEPKLRHKIDNVSERLDRSISDVLQRGFNKSDGQRDVHLDDPPSSQ
jgi:hypothetical protein